MLFDDRMPTKVGDEYWIRVEYKSKDNKLSGKWMVFSSVAKLDDLWVLIRDATLRGELGSQAKVATMKRNPNASDVRVKLICVYTYDWRDKADVLRVRVALRKLGVVSTLSYKTDEDTLIGKYASRGDRVSKYRSDGLDLDLEEYDT